MIWANLSNCSSSNSLSTWLGHLDPGFGPPSDARGAPLLTSVVHCALRALGIPTHAHCSFGFASEDVICCCELRCAVWHLRTNENSRLPFFALTTTVHCTLVECTAHNNGHARNKQAYLSDKAARILSSSPLFFSSDISTALFIVTCNDNSNFI